MIKISKGRITIFIKTTIYYMKNILKIIVVAIILIFIAFASKYKAMYKVTMAGETVGYVTKKSKIEKSINEYMNTQEGNVAYIDIKNLPQYEFNLVEKSKTDSTEEILKKIKEESTVTYKLYAIKLAGENKEFVSTVEEAEKVVKNLKEEFDGMIDLNISVEEVFTTDLNNIKTIDGTVAKNNLDTQIISESNSAVNGIILSKPVTGIISYRYGPRWGRSHQGIDVAASTGTPIYSCSKGTVKYAGWSNGYGNLIVINHGNGIETYYGHCSKICVSKGQEVTKDTLIGLVGSTGNSTGPHLHLEIRVNGVTRNPQNYLYK